MSAPRGSGNKSTMLTEMQVIRIRELAAEMDEWGRPKYSVAELARIYRSMGVNISTEGMRRIVRGETWGWLKTPAQLAKSADLPQTEDQKAHMARSIASVLYQAGQGDRTANELSPPAAGDHPPRDAYGRPSAPAADTPALAISIAGDITRTVTDNLTSQKAKDAAKELLGKD